MGWGIVYERLSLEDNFVQYKAQRPANSYASQEITGITRLGCLSECLMDRSCTGVEYYYYNRYCRILTGSAGYNSLITDYRADYYQKTSGKIKQHESKGALNHFGHRNSKFQVV